MSQDTMPFMLNFDLARLPDAGKEIDFAPSEEQCSAIAHWAGIDRLDGLKASVSLSGLGGGYFAYEAEFTADVVQACVVTLEPVRTHIAREFRRSFHVPENLRGKAAMRAGLLPGKIAVDEKELPEELSSSVLDIAAPILEELELAIDPYPRKPGVVFEPPADGEKAAAENPFEVLKKLKGKG